MTTGKNLTLVSTIPANIHVPLATEDVDAGTVEIPFQALGNYCQSVHEGQITVISGNVITVLSGGTIDMDSGSGLVVNGGAEFHGTGGQAVSIDEASAIGVDALTVNTSATFAAGTLLLMNNTSTASMQGRIRWRNRAFMTDADQTLDPATATQWELSANPGAARTIKLKLTGALNDETISLIVANMWNSGTDGDRYFIQRADATPIATFVLLGGLNSTVWARFRFVGSSWRLDENVGLSYNPTASKYYGCRPESGA